MKKTIPIIILLLGLLMLMPATLAFNMTIEENTITLQPGDNYKFNITFESNESINITNIERNDTVNEIQSYFSKTSFELNGTEQVEVLVVVDNNIAEGNYTLIFKAEDNNNNTNTTNLTVTIPQQIIHTNTGFHFNNDKELLLGGEHQERDTTITGTIEVYNDQNTTITNFNVNYDIDTRYQFTITSTIPTTINPYEKFNITYTAYIPKETDSQKTRIGTITYTSDQITGSKDVYAQAETKLRFYDIDFTSDDGDDSNLNDGDTIDVDLKPGSKAKFEIDLKNYFSDSEDIDINDAYIKMTIFDIDDGDDLEEETKEEDIKAEKKETYTLEFNIPENADEDTYTVLLEAFGEDDNGAEHYDKVELELKVEREKHDLRIKNVLLNPTVACIGDRVELKATLKNEGKKDEDRAGLLVEIKELNYKEYKVFSLDDYKGDHNEETATFTIDTKNAKPGEYKVTLKAYYDDNFINYAETKLYLEDCKKTEETTKTTTEEKPVAIIVEQKPVSELTNTRTSENTRTTEKVEETNITEDKSLLWLIIANIVLIIIVIIVIIAILLK